MCWKCHQKPTGIEVVGMAMMTFILFTCLFTFFIGAPAYLMYRIVWAMLMGEC